MEVRNGQKIQNSSIVEDFKTFYQRGGQTSALESNPANRGFLSAHAKAAKLTPAVNFINVKRTNFF